ncbi:MAG TPA: hypothetical protein VLA12_12520, partial [Planctomycetaceae bacterium]|nr:hypothetical protein [Planctomycetaceae bacterium]
MVFTFNVLELDLCIGEFILERADSILGHSGAGDFQIVESCQRLEVRQAFIGDQGGPQMQEFEFR